MSLIIECYHYYSNGVSIFVEVKQVIYKIALLSTMSERKFEQGWLGKEIT